MSLLETPNVNNPILDGRPPHPLWSAWFTRLAAKIKQLSAPTEYANNAAALAAGLTAGDFYRTGDTLKVVH